MMTQWFLPIDVMLFEMRRSLTFGRVCPLGNLGGIPSGNRCDHGDDRATRDGRGIRR